MVVTDDDPNEQNALKDYLYREFEMKDLVPLKYFHGIEVSRSKAGIFLYQRKDTLDLLQETGMLGCKPVDTPIIEGLKLKGETHHVPFDKKMYQRLVGRLMYLAYMRPDIAYTLSVVSQLMYNPGEQQMNDVMYLLWYLKSAPGKGILFKRIQTTKVLKYTRMQIGQDQKLMVGLLLVILAFVGDNLVI